MLVWVLFFGAVLADDCVDKDRGISDSNDHECNYYDAKPDQCGDFDTSEFVAADVCCSCEGQGWVHTVPPRETRPAPPREERSTAPPRERETPPPRNLGCYAFDEPEMDKANCDYSNKNNCVDFVPGGGRRCRFTCKEGYYPPDGDSEKLYMMCDQAGKWHANAACVTQNESPEDRRSAPPRTTGTLPTRAEETRQTTRQAIVTDSATLKSNEPESLSTEVITTNITVVSGDPVCGSTTWKSPKNYIQCATKPGVRISYSLSSCCLHALVSL